MDNLCRDDGPLTLRLRMYDALYSLNYLYVLN